MNSVTAPSSPARSMNVAAPIISLHCGIRSSFVKPDNFIVGEQAWKITPDFFAISIRDSKDGIPIFFIIQIAIEVIPGIMLMMFGIPSEGLPTGDISNV